MTHILSPVYRPDLYVTPAMMQFTPLFSLKTRIIIISDTINTVRFIWQELRLNMIRTAEKFSESTTVRRYYDSNIKTGITCACRRF